MTLIVGHWLNWGSPRDSQILCPVKRGQLASHNLVSPQSLLPTFPSKKNDWLGSDRLESNEAAFYVVPHGHL